MAHTAYHEIPKRLFAFRLLLPAIFVFFLGFFISGVIGQDMLPDAPIVGVKRPQDLSPEVLAEFEFVKFFHQAGHLPEMCVSGNTINDQEERQCDEYWEDFQNSAILAAVPFGCALVFVIMGIETLAGTYRRVRKRVEKGVSADLAGTVTDPPMVKGDFFSWLHGFNSIGVEIREDAASQIKVYLPAHGPQAMPGQTMALYKTQFFGKPKYLAILYAPHVAVVSGSRPGL